jgi:hypothetical protein
MVLRQRVELRTLVGPARARRLARHPPPTRSLRVSGKHASDQGNLVKHRTFEERIASDTRV